jgi:hypothetical protein
MMRIRWKWLMVVDNSPRIGTEGSERMIGSGGT